MNIPIEIYCKAEGRRVCYPRKCLPLWSILRTQVPEEVQEVRTRMCSPRDVYDALSSEIRRRISCIPLRRGRKFYIKQEEDEEEVTYPLFKANTIANLQPQISTPQPLHSHLSFQGIRQQVHSLTHEDGGEVTPPLPPNEEPQPRPLRNSAVYYPLPPSVAAAQLSYLNNSLGHPEVTGPRSFHTVILTANYSLRLEPDDFRGQQVQRTHAFNATLAEIQGPEGMPISSHVGHAVILFYPGEHERKPGTDTFWNDVLRLKTGCLDPEDLSIFSSVYNRDDDDDAVARAMQNDMGVDQDEDMDLDDDDMRLALRHRYSYPPDTGPANASVQLTPPLTLKVPLEEGEIFDPLPQSNYPWQTYMCRYDTTPANEPSIETQPFPILRGSTHPPTPHSALPSTFVLPIQRIITIKLDEARAVFRVPKDYTLRMHIDEGELTALV
ncbi:hypothetical protein ARMGADRAFT_1082792 [Armillaria gallica]|uniref:Uncharacterized protein n=1 Tax=Armillaria gallica TaxID=47427 RepID=A0A2H3DI41_ARMGA|nr:hypothetical protein ARMGADRAFT_1082792 [Armillaria gallica]